MSDIESVHELESDLFNPEEVDRFADPKEARKKALDYLARREYGQRELEQKLTAAGFETQVAVAVVEELAGQGLQDDRRFVENFVQSRVNQGKGPVRIRQELDERKVDASLIGLVLAETEEDWFGLARQVRSKKFGADMPATFKDKARQMRFLQYRGFDSAHIRAAVSSNGDK